MHLQETIWTHAKAIYVGISIESFLLKDFLDLEGVKKNDVRVEIIDTKNRIGM